MIDLLIYLFIAGVGASAGVLLMAIVTIGPRADLVAQLVIERKRRLDLEEELAGWKDWKAGQSSPRPVPPPFVVQDPGAPLITTEKQKGVHEVGFCWCGAHHVATEEKVKP